MREVNGRGGSGRQDILQESVVERVLSSHLCISICYCLKSPLLKVSFVSEVNVQRASAAQSVMFIVIEHGWSEGITVMCFVVLLRMSLLILWCICSAGQSSSHLVFSFSFFPSSPIFLLFVGLLLLGPVASSSILREWRPKEKLERNGNNKSRKEMHAE